MYYVSSLSAVARKEAFSPDMYGGTYPCIDLVDQCNGLDSRVHPYWGLRY